MQYRMIVVGMLMALGIGCSAQAQDCDANQASMNQCASQEYKALDAELNTQYNAQMGYLKTPARKKALQDAQKKWIAFRDADCQYQAGKREEGGSMWPLAQAQCLSAQTKVRVEQLKAYAACRDEGCPK
ncbi:lysozyme inhibitor LprI family protein [Pseudomonas sp. KU26590]|uniref:lysozyme inhibitor LprI family protein n=1 Tax=Pseudomonas sp. KU26590 TaxID=2991051 RepID=UPI00223D63EE|nr:lysozyme inhibitor LprI family protein [Pseudomonas sp. KU26590]UZJ58938.1 lysozyme inhibitor LprI family protein [Pseudomonas sp. KU26590]